MKNYSVGQQSKSVKVQNGNKGYIMVILKLQNGNELLECGHFKLVHTQKIFPRNIDQQPDLCIHANRARVHQNRPKPENPYAVLSSKMQAVWNELDDEPDKLTLYNNRSLNYEKMSTYNKGTNENVKYQPSKPTNHNTPLGPGSVVSRFDINYSPSIGALVTSPESFPNYSNRLKQETNHATKTHTNPAINYVIPTKINSDHAKLQNKVGETIAVPNPQIQYRAPLPMNLKVLAKKW